MPDAPSFADASAGMQAALETANADAPVTNEVPAATPTTETAPAVETPAEPTYSIDGLDLSGLDETALKKIQDGFLRQQDYTRKTQEIAPLRKLVEETGTDVDSLRQSFEFVQRLENDPDFLAEVALKLQEYVPGKETPGATEQPLTPIETPQGADPNLVRQIEDLNAWRAQQEQERINAQLVAEYEVEIQKAENAIRESNTSYDDDDIKEIYRLSKAHDWDLFKAQEDYEYLRNRFVNAQLKPKLNHPNAANPVSGGTLSTQPSEIKTFEDAAAATRERVRVAGN